ncbi:MAG: MFS transporter [Clostridia bacterium]|nr:MFS transporter [Clostridia bacterium]
MGIISKYFANKNEMSEREYTYARFGFIADVAFINGAGCFLAGAYLTGLLSMLGATEAQSNFILSLVLPSSFVQLLVPIINRCLTHKKAFVYFTRILEIFLPAVAFLLPMFFDNWQSLVWVVGILFFIKYSIGWIGSPANQDMLMNCLSEGGGIGKFSGIRSSVSNVVCCVAAFVAGQIAKAHTGDREVYGYMYLAIIALAFLVCEAVVFFFVKEPYTEGNKKAPETEGFVKTFKKMFSNSNVMGYIRQGVLHTSANNLANPIINILCIQRLGLSLEVLSYLSVISLLVRIVLAPIAGKLSDKIGCRKVMTFGLMVAAVAYVIHANMTVANVLILKVISVAISCFGDAALGAPSFAYMFESLPLENRASYMSCISVFTHSISYVVSLVATFIIGVCSGMTFNVFGIDYSVLSLLLYAAAVLIMLSALTLIGKPKKE